MNPKLFKDIPCRPNVALDALTLLQTTYAYILPEFLDTSQLTCHILMPVLKVPFSQLGHSFLWIHCEDHSFQTGHSYPIALCNSAPQKEQHALQVCLEPRYNKPRRKSPPKIIHQPISNYNNLTKNCHGPVDRMENYTRKSGHWYLIPNYSQLEIFYFYLDVQYRNLQEQKTIKKTLSPGCAINIKPLNEKKKILNICQNLKEYRNSRV